MKVDILSFSGNLDIESFLDWIYEVDKFFDIAYVFLEKQVKFMKYKLNGGAATWWVSCLASQNTLKRRRDVIR